MAPSPLSFESAALICDLLSVRRSLTLEQLVALLPELTWNQIFTTVDDLSRRGEIILFRRGFSYEVEWSTAKPKTLSCVG